MKNIDCLNPTSEPEVESGAAFLLGTWAVWGRGDYLVGRRKEQMEMG